RLAYGALIQSTIANGRVSKIDFAAAQSAPGVIGILTRENAPSFKPYPDDLTKKGAPGESRVPLEDDQIHWVGQHLGVVVAESFEQAMHAASLVRVEYENAPAILTLPDERAQQNSLQPEKFIGRENVHIVCPFVGGAFGSKGFQWSHTLLAVAAAKLVQRPVKLTFSRPQMFDSAGQRARTEQKFSMAASREGKLSALRHATTTHCSPVSEYTEACGNTSRMLYSCPNIDVSHRLLKLNLTT